MIRPFVAGLTLICIFAARASSGCQCGSDKDPRRGFEESPQVLDVQIESRWVTTYPEPLLGHAILAKTFGGRVLRVHKGPQLEHVRFADARGNCSFPFERGRTYLVFARPHPVLSGYLESSVCDPTAEARAARASFDALEIPPAVASPPKPDSAVRRASRRVATYFFAGLSRADNLTQKELDSHPVARVWLGFAALLLVAPLVYLAWVFRRKAVRVLAFGAAAAISVVVVLIVVGYNWFTSLPFYSEWLR